MAAKRIQLIKDFVEKTAKRLLDYPDIAKQLQFERMFSRCKLFDRQVPLYQKQKPLTKEEIDTIEQNLWFIAWATPWQRLFYTARLGAEFVKQTAQKEIK